MQTPPAPAQRPPWYSFAFHVAGRAASNFTEDRGTQLAASISYYALFSLFPLTLLVVSIFGIVLRDAEVQARVLDGITDYVPLEQSTVEQMIGSAADLGPTVSIVSFLGAIWSAGALSAAIRSAMNVVFEVRTRRPILRAKLVDFVLLPVIGIPLVGGIVLSAGVRFFERELDERYGLLDGRFSWTWDVGVFFIPLTMTFIAIVALYRIAPNRAQPFRYIWPGALLAALAFEALKGGFGLYLEHFFNESIYGSLASVIILLFWVYLASNILIFGGEVAAEIPHVLHAEPRHGTRNQGDWKHAALAFLQGLFMVPEEEEPPEEEPAARSVEASPTAARTSRADESPAQQADASG